MEEKEEGREEKGKRFQIYFIFVCFRSIIRYFNDVGYIKNGRFEHLMGSIQEKKSEISATGVLLRSDRFGIVDYIICPFRLGLMSSPLSISNYFSRQKLIN